MNDSQPRALSGSFSLLRVVIPYAPIIDFCLQTLLFFTVALFLKTRIQDAHPLILGEVVLVSVAYGGAWVLFAMSRGFYRFQRTRRFMETVGRIFGLTFLALIAALAVQVLLVGKFTFHYKFFHRRFFFLALALLGGIYSIWYAVLSRIRTVLQLLGYNRRRLLIAGTGEVAAELVRKVNGNPLWGFTVTGFLAEVPPVENAEFEGKPVIGSLSDVVALSTSGRFDRLVACLPAGSHEKLMDLVTVCEKHNIDVMFVPALQHFVTSRSEVVDLDGIPLMRLYESPMQGLGGVFKRLMDFFGSGLGLLLLSPLLALLALLVKLSSPGPVFYGQERVGLDNRPFMMWKFRSMRIDAEATGAKMTAKDDPRKTWIGGILRRYSLDELPQLWNVFIGQMSLVGPRPERPVFVEQFRESITGYMKRHRVKAGMTGWAQVNGLRGSETSLQTRIEFDLYYIENWSLLFDLEILLRTIGVVLHDETAL